MPDDWWRRGTIYQIYPRSFQDTSGDGVGDLDGVRQRLDYLVWLGIDAIWLSPFYPSPMHDFGYDVSDYCDVDPLFGSLDDFDALVSAAHAKGLKIIIDFVPNHTSNEHPWFLASRSGRDNRLRDWYLWRDAAPNGGPPNNWFSHFGGSAWSLDEGTRQYYLHSFLPEQPDLNWRNPQVRAAMYDVLRFWLRRGVDGFRVDVISHMIKDAAFRDNPANPNFAGEGPDIARLAQTYSSDQPEVHDVIAEMRRVVDEFPDRVLLGEIYLPIERLIAYYGKELGGVHLPFNFQLLDAHWDAATIGALIEEYEAALPQGAWPNWVLSNHDRPRIAARVGAAQARLATMLLLTLRGTPTLYYGDEIGISHVDIPPERAQDPWGKREPNLGVGRDPSRTPMQWDASAFAGFSTRETWLPLTPDFATRNVATMREDDTSLLCLTSKLLHYRHAHPALGIGSQRLFHASDHVLAYERLHGADRILVALNFCRDASSFSLPKGLSGAITLSTHSGRSGEPVRAKLDFRGDEGVVIKLDS